MRCYGASAGWSRSPILTREDGERFMALAGRLAIRTEVTDYPLERANEALHALRRGELSGAAVLRP
jgi:alcohol dehydrogenase, propanol-preferring